MFHDYNENLLQNNNSNYSENLSSFLHLSKLNIEANNNLEAKSLDDDDNNDLVCPFCPKLLKRKDAYLMLNNALY